MIITKKMIQRYAEYLHRYSHIRVRGEADNDPVVWDGLRKRALSRLTEVKRVLTIAKGGAMDKHRRKPCTCGEGPGTSPEHHGPLCPRFKKP